MLQFRQIKDADDQLYTEVLRILHKSGQSMFLNEGLSHWLKPYPLEKLKEDISDKAVFLAMQSNEVLGTFMLTKNKTQFFKDEDNYIYLSKFAVAPNHSKKGLGTQCLDFIEDWAKKHNYIGVRLDVYEKSIPAINFYKKNNFQVVSTGKTTNFNVICMQKRWELQT